MKTLSHDEMYKVFRKLGFSDFVIRDYDDEIEEILSLNGPDSGEKYVCERVHVIDVIPGGCEDGVQPGISLMEKHYYRRSRYRKLCEKWQEIIIQFLCYYPLESLFVDGMALVNDIDFLEKTPNQDGYILEFDKASIQNLDDIFDLVTKKTHASITFWFESLQMAIHYVRDDVYLFASVKKQTEENAQAVALLEKLVTAQGLFLL